MHVAIVYLWLSAVMNSNPVASNGDSLRWMVDLPAAICRSMRSLSRSIKACLATAAQAITQLYGDNCSGWDFVRQYRRRSRANCVLYVFDRPSYGCIWDYNFWVYRNAQFFSIVTVARRTINGLPIAECINDRDATDVCNLPCQMISSSITRHSMDPAKMSESDSSYLCIRFAPSEALNVSSRSHHRFTVTLPVLPS